MHGILLEHAGCPLMWESSRQSFIAQSTAEAELLGFNEAYQAGESMAAMLQVMGFNTVRILYGDNKAALAQCNQDTGPWRTRHLRLRSAKLREALHQEGALWQARHMSGQDLVADGLTKSLQGQSFQRFKEKLCLVGQRVSAVVKKAIGGRSAGTVEAEEQKKVWRDRATIVLAAAGGALISAGRVVSGCMLILGLLGSQKAMQAWKHLGGQGDAEKPKMMVLRALQPEEEPESRGTGVAG